MNVPLILSSVSSAAGEMIKIPVMFEPFFDGFTVPSKSFVLDKKNLILIMRMLQRWTSAGNELPKKKKKKNYCNGLVPVRMPRSHLTNATSKADFSNNIY